MRAANSELVRLNAAEAILVEDGAGLFKLFKSTAISLTGS